MIVLWGTPLGTLQTRPFPRSSCSEGSHGRLAHLEEGDDAIPGDGLEQAWSPGQALQASATGGEEGADDNDPGGRPGQHADDKVPLQGLPEPVGQVGRAFEPELKPIGFPR